MGIPNFVYFKNNKKLEIPVLSTKNDQKLWELASLICLVPKKCPIWGNPQLLLLYVKC